jgi:protease-4
LAAFRDYYDNSGGIQEKYHSLAHYGRDKVAVINVGGVIMEGDGFVKRQIDRVRDDERVRAVVVRIDSPGGTITGSDFIYHHLKKLREERKIPLVVSMGGVAASGGYYVAMAVGDADKSIFAEPTTTTGSIGVIIPHYDLSGLLERLDVKDDSIASHPRKQMLSMTRPLAPEDREILTRYINESFERFKEVVRAGRPSYREDKAALDDLATGEIFTATQAQQHGLVDEIGFVEDAIERAIQLAGLDKEKVRVVQYKQPLTLLSAMGWGGAPSGDYSLTSLLELTAPRAYYLSTSLPPLLSTHGR